MYKQYRKRVKFTQLAEEENKVAEEGTIYYNSKFFQ